MSLSESLFQRIADFLDDYPPFQYLGKEDLLQIARLVKIKFHERDETIFEENTPRRNLFYVIHNGSVRVFNRKGKKHQLRDLRVEGELLGIGHISGLSNYTQSAVAENDTILYSIPWEPFSQLLPAYPDVMRFLRANTSLHPESRSWGGAASEMLPGDPGADTLVGHINETTYLPQIVQKRFLACHPNDTLQEAAYKMLQNELEAIIVVDQEGLPKGMITKTDMTRCIQAGRLPRKALAKEFMSAPVITVGDNPRLGDCMRLMLKSGCRFLCMTKDGSSFTPATGVISERDLMLYYGNNPMVIIRQIGISDNFEELTHLRYRADMLMLNELRSVDAILWFSEVVHDLNCSFARRVLELAQADLRAEGYYPPDVDICWMAAGAGGRKELFTRTAMDRGMVFKPLSAPAEAHANEYLNRLTAAISNGLIKCGWTPNTRQMTEANIQWNRSLNDWEAYFHQWINHTLEDELPAVLPWFDLLPIAGDEYLVDSFQSVLVREIASHPAFIRRLATVTITSIPKPEFYESFSTRGSREGERRFDIAHSVLQPLSHLARLFALREGIVKHTSTIDRFNKLAKISPANRPLFEDAAEGFKIALFCSAKTGLREQSPGNLIEPATLTGIEQQSIKSTFRSIFELQNLAESLTA